MSESDTIRALVEAGRIAVVGALYDVGTGKMDFMLDEAIEPASEARQERGAT